MLDKTTPALLLTRVAVKLTPVGFRNRARAFVLRRLRPHLPIEAWVEPNDNVVQVGTPRIRTVKRLLRASSPDGTVTVVEALSENVATLRTAISELPAEDATRVVVVHAAAFSHSAVLELEVSASHPGDHFLRGLDASNDNVGREGAAFGTTEHVQAHPIDHILDEHGRAGTNVMIITVNGAELEVLRGAELTLRQMQPGSRVFAKGHSMVSDGRPLSDLIEPFLSEREFVTVTTRSSNSPSAHSFGRRQGDVFAYVDSAVPSRRRATP